MNNQLLIIICLINHVIGFTLKPPKIIRYSVVRNSHFSTIQTTFRNRDLLFQTLEELDYQVINNNEQISINSYNNQNTIPEIIIKQSNGYDIGFILKDDDYQLVSDLQFWNLPIPVNVFLEKITQKYTLNSVLKAAKDNDYITDEIKLDKKTGIIEIEISRYNY